MIISNFKKELQLFFSNFSYGITKKDLKRNKFLILGGLTIATSLFTVFIFAINITPPNYALPFYIKRVQEKALLKALPTSELKADYYLALQEKRLNDLAYIVDNRIYGCLLACAGRYSGNAGELTKFIKSHHLMNKKTVTIETFKNHRHKLEELVNKIPKDQNLDWKYVVDSQNYLDSYIAELYAL